MNAKELGSMVAKMAPILGDVIGTAYPGAGLLISVVAKLFGASTDYSDIAQKISNDPDAEVKLKQFEYDHQNALIQAQLSDSANARSREEEIVKITGKRDVILDFIAILVVMGFFGLCVINYFIRLDDDHIVTMLVGQISSGFMLCLSYYFGSSNKS